MHSEGSGFESCHLHKDGNIYKNKRRVAKPGNAPALGAGDRKFESCPSDMNLKETFTCILPSPEEIEALKDKDSKEYALSLRDIGLDLLEQDEVQSLYDSLHRVGDDPLKGAIQRSLRASLDEDTYKLVELIFHFHTENDIW